MRYTRPLAALMAAASLASAGMTQAQAPTDSAPNAEEVVRGLTAPSARRQLAFSSTGIIRQMSVREGDTVKQGDVLAEQDTVAMLAELKRLQIEADQSLMVGAREKSAANKKVMLDRKVRINNESGGVNSSEVEEAQLDYELATIEIALAKRDGLAKQAAADVQAARLDQMKLVSPVNGVVLKIDQGAGEVADSNKPTLTVIANDPLYIELRQLNTGQVANMKVGQTMQVRYPGSGAWQTAKINWIADEADARSDTQTIRLEMPNPDRRATGLPIDINIASAKMPADSAAARN